MTDGRTIPKMIAELAEHVTTALELADHPLPGPFQGAVNTATVAAYRLAATEAQGEAAHADKVAALKAFVVAVEPGHGPFRAALIDAALAAEVDARVARGAPIYGRRLRDWMDPLASPAAGGAVVPATSAPHSVTRVHAEAEALDDVDSVLLTTIALTRAMRRAAERGESRQTLLDAYEAAALGLCVRPATSGVDDARYLLLHMWTLLRRKRPLAAAVIRARVRWSRTVRPGP